MPPRRQTYAPSRAGPRGYSRRPRKRQASLKPSVSSPDYIGSFFKGPDIPSFPEIGYKKTVKETKTNIPLVERRSPTDFIGKIPFSKIIGHPILRGILSPSKLAEPWLDELSPERRDDLIGEQILRQNPDLDDMVVRPQPLETYPIELPTAPLVEPQFIRPKVPIIPWNAPTPKGPYITTSPKIGTITYSPPRYIVSAPVLVEIPHYHPLFTEPTIEEIPPLLDGMDVQTQFELKPDLYPESAKLPQLGTISKLKEKTISIEVSTDPKMQPIVRFRPSYVKAATKRKKEKKKNSKWIKLANLAISLTYGTYTEVMDFVEILVWDAYIWDPRTRTMRYAMHETEGDMVETLKGIAEGKYSVDISATLVDYAVSQAQDIIIGQISRTITKTVVDTGNWRSPQGPQGFVNKMQKDYKNAILQYEKTGNESTLLPKPTEYLSERRLWNAKSGLSPYLWSESGIR